MSTTTILGIAIGLAMDAFAVAIVTSVMLRGVSPRQVFRFAFHFGLFQAMMPVIGWAAGSYVIDYLAAWDHWIAFGLLGFIGGKAVIQGLQSDKPERDASNDPTRGLSLVMFSVATSIDALAVGISFAALDVSLWYACVLIGITAAAFTTVGMLFGARLGSRLGHRMEIVGGLVLIAIGLKILIEDLRMHA